LSYEPILTGGWGS